MKEKLVIFLILVCAVQMYSVQSEETAALTCVVTDVYGVPVDNAMVSCNYVYPQDDDVEIPYQFTKNGVATFYLEPEREYTLTVTKAGFLPQSEEVELKEDTTITVILEYAQAVPVLHMRTFSVSPQEVGPGEQFEVRVIIENEGKGDALNVKADFNPAQYFSPVQPRSSAYFERLDVGKQASVVQSFAVSGETLSGIYDLVLTITYQDSQALSYTVQETVGVSVLRKPLVKLLNVNYPQEVGQGETFTFSVDVANTGRFTVNGLYVEVISDMDWTYYSYYVGSLEAGDFDTFESDVLSQDPGEHSFVIRLGFTDDFNRETYEEQSFSVFVTEKVKEIIPPEQNEGLWARIIRFLKSFLGLD